jgi:hypothetical protein
MSQVRISSFAGTTARPAPVVRDELVAAMEGSVVQTAFAVPEATIPKVLRCSQRLFFAEIY